MNRRSFMASILAAGVAPYVMSNGIASGILMPVKKPWVPGMAVLRLYSTEGKLLSTMTYPADLDCTNMGIVHNDGIFARAELDHPFFGKLPVKLNLANENLYKDTILNMMPLTIR